MIRTGRKPAAFLAAAGAALLLAQPIWASGSDREGGTGAGTFAEMSFVAAPTVTTTVDGTTLISETTTGTYTGTISGTFTEVLDAAVFVDGTQSFSGFETCVCTVAGRSGTFVDRFSGTGAVPNFTGTLTVLRGTGALANLRATAKFSGAVNLSTGLASGQYSVRYHFGSDS